MIRTDQERRTVVQRDIIVIGASAGGIEALRVILPMLPADLPAAGMLVVHRQSVEDIFDQFPKVLGYEARLPVCTARDGQRIEKGRFYLAPGGSHLVVQRGILRLEQSPKESFNRPSADVLFRSAALAYGRRVVGVVLSGVGHDGAIGLWQIKDRGGVTIVQKREEAGFNTMPSNAIANVPVDFELSLHDIAPKLIALACGDASGGGRNSEQIRILVVEDEFALAAELESNLRGLGYDVVACVPSGNEAVSTAASAAPDVVLMDIKLADEMRGTEAAATIWRRFQIPVIFMTAYADQKTLEDANLSMPFGYVVKPYSQAQVHAAIQIALDRYRRENAS